MSSGDLFGKLNSSEPKPHTIRSIVSNGGMFCTLQSYKLAYNERYTMTDSIRSHNRFTFIVVDEHDNPQKWIFSEHPDSFDPDTADIFVRVRSEKHDTYFVVCQEYLDDLPYLEREGWEQKCCGSFYNYEDFAKVFTASKGRILKEDPPHYVRDPRKALYQMWYNHIVRANEASHDHYSLDEIEDTHVPLKQSLREIVWSDESDVEKYEKIRGMVLNFDLISSEVRAEYFP